MGRFSCVCGAERVESRDVAVTFGAFSIGDKTMDDRESSTFQGASCTSLLDSGPGTLEENMDAAALAEREGVTSPLFAESEKILEGDLFTSCSGGIPILANASIRMSGVEVFGLLRGEGFSEESPLPTSEGDREGSEGPEEASGDVAAAAAPVLSVKEVICLIMFSGVRSSQRTVQAELKKAECNRRKEPSANSCKDGSWNRIRAIGIELFDKASRKVLSSGEIVFRGVEKDEISSAWLPKDFVISRNVEIRLASPNAGMAVIKFTSAYRAT